MKIVINNNGERIPATLEVVDGVMIVSPVKDKVDITKFKDGDYYQIQKSNERRIAMNEDPMKYLIPELKIDEWYPIEYFQYIPNGVTAIHCDTRDFEMVISKDALDKSIVIQECVNVFNMIKQMDVDNKYLIHRNDIPQWLKYIEEISGGKCIWRCLNFTTINTKLGWLKYIRMYHYKDDYFVVCDGYAEPIDWQTMNEETLKKEYLNAH